MTHFNHKEEEFKNLLEGLDLGIDTETVWNEVEHRLPYNKNDYRLPFGFWILSGLFAVGLISLLFANPDTARISAELSMSDITETTSDKSDLYAGAKAYEEAIEKVHNAKTSENVITESNSWTTNELVQESSNNNNNLVHKPFKAETTSIATAFDSNVHNSNLSLYSSESKSESTIGTWNDATANQRELISRLPLLDQGLGLLQNKGHEIYLDQSASSSLDLIKLPSPLALTPFYSTFVGPNQGNSRYSEHLVTSENGDRYKRLPFEEVDLPGVSSHLEFGLEYGKWRFVSGLNYSLLAAQYKSDAYVVSSREIESAQGGTTTESTISKNDFKIHRFQNNLDLRLGIGYSLISSSKFKVSINLGSIYNIFSKSKGYFLADNLEEVVRFDGIEDSTYRQSNGIGGELSLVMERKIGEHFSLLLKPYFSQYLNPINTNTASYKLENSQVGLLMGISYRPSWNQ